MTTPTLREYLAAGGRLNPVAHHDLLDAVTSSATSTVEQRADRSVSARYQADTLEDGGEINHGHHLTTEQRLETVQSLRFLADYLDAYPAPDLDALIRAAVPESVTLHVEPNPPAPTLRDRVGPFDVGTGGTAGPDA